jgi:hypothetical protein
VPLFHWYAHDGVFDNFTTTSSAWNPDIVGTTKSGYDFIAVLGYVYSSPAAGRCELKLYYHAGVTDNYSSVFVYTPATGYAFAEPLGYVVREGASCPGEPG